jgi:hypothetical protein
MKIFTRSRFSLFAVLAGAFLAPLALKQEPISPHTTQSVQRILATWGEESRKAAHAMIEKYGPPDEVVLTRLIWHNNGPWLRTVVYREEVAHRFPMEHVDVLEQTISFRVPPEKFTELAQFDGSVICERTKGEISARCDKEEANFLALNVAHDIIQGERSVEDARQFYADTVARMMAGEESAYTRGLRFRVMPPERARDPDEPAEPAVRAREAGAPRDGEDD